MNSVTINTTHDLDATLQQVPDWPAHKRQEFLQLASFLRFAHGWAPPLTVIPGEAPDFIISGGGLNASVELTYAASQSWEDAEAALGRSDAPAPQISRISLENIRYRGKQLREYLANDAPKRTWSSDSQARAKARELCEAVQRKAHQSLSDCSLNWLLVIDKLPFLSLDLNAFVPHLPSSPDPFQAIFFVSERWFTQRRLRFLLEIGSSGAKVIRTADDDQYIA